MFIHYVWGKKDVSLEDSTLATDKGAGKDEAGSAEHVRKKYTYLLLLIGYR